MAASAGSGGDGAASAAEDTPSDDKQDALVSEDVLTVDNDFHGWISFFLLAAACRDEGFEAAANKDEPEDCTTSSGQSTATEAFDWAGASRSFVFSTLDTFCVPESDTASFTRDDPIGFFSLL